MTVLRHDRRAKSWLRRHRWGALCGLLSISLSASCVLSPTPDLPSMMDGADDLDGSPASGGSSSASGGGSSCPQVPPSTECRGAELWMIPGPGSCGFVESLLSTCESGCVVDAAGVAACAEHGGGGAGGGGGAAGATSTSGP